MASSRRLNSVAWPLGPAFIAVALVLYFDLQTNFPFLDEYLRRWTIQRLADGQSLVLVGISPNFVETALAMPAALLHLDPMWWRLAGIPFLPMAGVFAGLLARRLGADKFWAAVAATLVVANPIGLSLATGMMTETAFVGLLLGATWFSLRWVADGKGVAWAILFAVLCTLQRQQGIAIAVMVTAGLLRVRSRRPLRWGDAIGLALLWFALLASVGGVMLIERLGPSLPDLTPGGVPVLSPFSVLVAVTALPILASFFFMPFLGAILHRPRGEAGRWTWIDLAPVTLGAFGAVWAGLASVVFLAEFYLGNTWTNRGLGPVTSGGLKPALLPLPVFLGIEILTLVCMLALLVWRRRAWRSWVLSVEGSLLLLLAVVQFVIVAQHGTILDRYYFMVLAPLVPLVAATASRSSTGVWEGVWAVVVLMAGVGLYAVGEQDYQAWQAARAKTAQMAYASHPIDDVDAGFEQVAVHLGIPAMDDTTGSLPRRVRDRPSVSLVFASTDDPRPGVSYRSIAPGKIVIQVNHYPAGPAP